MRILIGCLDGAGLGSLDGKARGRGRKRRFVATGERNGKRLAQTRHNGHAYGAAAQYIALERGAGGVNGALASTHAHAAALGHATGHATLDNIAGSGILRKEGYSVSSGTFMKFGVPFTLAAVISGYLLVWLIWM